MYLLLWQSPPAAEIHKKRRRPGRNGLLVPTINNNIIAIHLFILWLHWLPSSCANAAAPPEAPETKSVPATTQPELSPSKLALFTKTLHKIVGSHCAGIVDDLELDTFQAYLNRQILQGGTQTLRHPLHFNALYRNLTVCVNILLHPTSRPAQNNSNPTEKLEEKKNYVDSSRDDGGRKGKKPFESPTTLPPSKKFLISSAPIKQSNRSTTATSTTTTTRKPSTTTSTGKPSTTSKRTFTSSKPPLKSSTSKKPENNNEHKDTKKPSSSNVAKKALHATKEWFSKTYKKVTHWLGRRKRDLDSDSKEAMVYTSSDDKLTPFYSKVVAFDEKKKMNEVSSSEEDKSNYHLRWNSMTAAKGRMTAYLHFLHMLRNMIYVSVHTCPKEFPVDFLHIAMVGEYLASLVLEELIHDESQRMYVKINEHLENAMQTCVSKF